MSGIKQVNVVMQQRHDTSTNWNNSNPILDVGEIGYETDTNKLKIGDGTTAWKNLSYLDSMSEGQNTILSKLQVDDNGVLEVKNDGENSGEFKAGNAEFERLVVNGADNIQLSGSTSDTLAEELERINKIKYYNNPDLTITPEICFNTAAEDDTTITGLTEYGKTLTLTNIVIPYSMNNKIISKIGDSAFSGNTNIKTVVLPNSIKTIDADAFSNCTSLTSINIPDSVTGIYGGAFAGSGLTSISIPNSVKTINASFDNCTNLKTVYCEQGSEADKYFTNNYPNINIIYTDIKKTKLDNIKYYDKPVEPTDEKYFDFANGIIDLTDAGKRLTNIVIPPKINGELVTIINDNFLCGVDFSESNERLESITLPNTITTIGEYAFTNSFMLKNINIPDSVTDIGPNAFYRSSIENITLPNSLTTISEGMFSDCSLVTLTVPNTIKSVGEHPFLLCNTLKTVYCEQGSYIEEYFNSAEFLADRSTSESSNPSLGNLNIIYTDITKTELNNKADIYKIINLTYNTIKTKINENTGSDVYIKICDLDGMFDNINIANYSLVPISTDNIISLNGSKDTEFTYKLYSGSSTYNIDFKISGTSIYVSKDSSLGTDDIDQGIKFILTGINTIVNI